MRTLGLIVREALYRKLSFGLGLLGVAAAVALFVFFFTAGEASRRETARLTRNMGLNLRIIPKDTDMDRFWLVGFSDRTMPEDYVHRLAAHSGLNYSHLLPTLKRRMQWRGTEVILVGTLPEMSAVDRQESPMTLAAKPGAAWLGYELARRFGVEKNDTIDLLGKTLTVAGTLPESGSEQDASIFAQLHDVQAMVKTEGAINEIQALNCVCFDTDRDALEVLREQLASALPDAKVLQIRPIADAREKQRRLVEDYLAVIIPFIVVVCAAWLGVLAMMNVRERRCEIGILRALGYGSGTVASLFLGRAAVVGIVGGALGFAVGTALALTYGPQVFKVTGQAIRPMYALLVWSVLAAPAFAGLAAVIPTMLAVTQDPAVTLRDT
ncbi:MAG: ABC transporter permease [Planctomycetes bacterium]|nr:ABC transporter permease [Planctomycetota bacterium]